MIIEIEFKDQEITGRIESSDSIGSFGGEFWDDDYHHESYGLQFEDIMITDLKGEQYKTLAISMINHLFANGYDFAVDRDVNGYYLREMKQPERPC
jgi:hypothetical protein